MLDSRDRRDQVWLQKVNHLFNYDESLYPTITYTVLTPPSRIVGLVQISEVPSLTASERLYTMRSVIGPSRKWTCISAAAGSTRPSSFSTRAIAVFWYELRSSFWNSVQDLFCRFAALALAGKRKSEVAQLLRPEPLSSHTLSSFVASLLCGRIRKDHEPVSVTYTMRCLHRGPL